MGWGVRQTMCEAVGMFNAKLKHSASCRPSIWSIHQAQDKSRDWHMVDILNAGPKHRAMYGSRVCGRL